VANDLSSLSEKNVRQLSRIIEALENSPFDFLQLEVGELKVTLGKGGTLPIDSEAAPQPASAAPVTQPVVAPPPAAPASALAASAAPGTVDVTAPILGLFYAQPEPGAPPFVQVGDSVRPDTTIGLVEVMKTFNAVSAGVAGTIVEICVGDTQMVEYGQVLVRMAPG
jgi:acetyl-CoA carboxylase biotin carboxyl carrier protein